MSTQESVLTRATLGERLAHLVADLPSFSICEALHEPWDQRPSRGLRAYGDTAALSELILG